MLAQLLRADLISTVYVSSLETRKLKCNVSEESGQIQGMK
jgi:hypothetical protein